MRQRTRFITAGSVAALTLACTHAWADTLDGNLLIGTSGDGLIFSDPANAVLFNLAATEIGLGGRLVDGLFGEGGFDGLPTASFPIAGRDDDFFEVNLGFQSLISSSTVRDIRIEAGYGGAFGDTYERHGIQFGMNVQF